MKPATISKSTNSGSDSRGKTKYVVSRLFNNRDVRVEPTTEKDLKWFWAAYKKGAWQSLIRDDLTTEEFLAHIEESLMSLVGLYTIYAPNETGRIAGAVSLSLRQFDDIPYFEPRITWFPWATPRNRIEGGVRTVLTLREEYPLFIQVDGKNQGYVTHLAKYGILRRVGKLDQANRKIWFFESMEAK